LRLHTELLKSEVALEDFHNSAHRHYRCGDILCDRSEHAEADHLYGLAAECALKRILEQAGLRKNDGKDLKVHVNKLWSETISRLADQKYTLLISYLSQGNKFSDWDISRRYHPDKTITEDVMSKHKLSANVIFRFLSEFVLSGGYE
jgi:hypothetical protein